MNRSNLKREVDLWVDEKIITQEQAEKLYQRYKLSANLPFYQQSGFILKALSVALVGFGLFLIIKESWVQLPAPIQASIGILPLLAVFIFAYYAFREKKTEKAQLLLFLGNILLGVNLFLQTDIFHISLTTTLKLFLWFLLILPSTILLKSTLDTILSLFVFGLFQIEELKTMQFYISSIPVFLILAYPVYHKMSRLVLLMAIYNIFLFSSAIYFLFYPNKEISWNFVLLQKNTLFFIFLIVLPMISQKYGKIDKTLSKILSQIFYIAILFSVYAFFTSVDNYSHSFETMPSMVSWALLILAMALYIVSPKKLTINISLGGVILMFSIHVVRFYQTIFKDIETKKTISLCLLITANLFFLTSALLEIRYGLKNKIKKEFFLGVIMILILTFTRYIHYIQSPIVTAISFILLAGLIYYLNRLWNKKIMLNQI